MSIDQPQLEKLIRARAVGQIVDALEAAGEPARRALAAGLRGHLAQLNAPGGWQRRAEAWPLLVAGAGCVPGVAGVVSWLRHRDLRWAFLGNAPDPVVRLLSAPGRPALGAVGRQLATRMRVHTIDSDWPVTEAVLRAAGAEPPAGDVFVRGWVRRRRQAADLSQPMLATLRADPWLTAMVGRMFEVDGLAAELTGDWPQSVVALVAEGKIRRDVVLAGLLWRMRAGDRALATGHILKIHFLLGVTVDEVADRREQYLGLLFGANRFVVEHAQLALRDLDRAGRLPVEAFAEATRALLPRAEKKLVRAHLSWLDAVARRHRDQPAVLAGVLGAAAVGVGNEANDLADRALTVIARHLPAAGTAGRAAVIAELPELSGDRGRRAAGLLGLEPPPPEPAIPDATPTGPSPAGEPVLAAPPPIGPPAREPVLAGPPPIGPPAGEPVLAMPPPIGPPAGEPVLAAPPPIGSVAELAGELRAFLRGLSDPVALERIVDAAVRLARTDRDGLAAAVSPLLPFWGAGTWHGELFNVLRAAGGEPHWSAPPEPSRHFSPPEEMLRTRLAELADRLAAAPAPVVVLSTPATVTGHVCPERVLGLLSRAERDGVGPGPVELAQALLRLPREVDASVTAAAAALASPAGRLFHRWLAAGGLPDPAVTTVRVPKPECANDHGSYHYVRYCHCVKLPAFRAMVEVPAPPAARVAGLAVPARLLGLPADAGARQRLWSQHWTVPTWVWPSVTPSHREIAAAHIQPMIVPVADEDRSGGTDILPALARCSGPFGPAMALALAYGLAARHERDRLPAVDALVELARRGEVSALLGRELGELAGGGVVVLARVVGSLAEANRAGAAHAVYAVTAAMLPALLGRNKARPGTPDLLELAATAAESTPGREPDPALRAAVAAVADRPGGSRLVVEARRLARVLG